jgi:hypothetical protein
VSTESKASAGKVIPVPADSLERLLSAAEGVGGQYVGVHPVLRECHEAACEVRSAMRLGVRE